MRLAMGVVVTIWILGCAGAPRTRAPGGMAPSAEALATARFHALLEEAWEQRLRENPTYATLLGDRRYDDRLPDASLEAIERRQAFERELLERIQQLDPAALPGDERLNHALFLRNAALAVEGHRFPSELMPVTPMGGPHTLLPVLVEMAPPRTEAELQAFLQRLRAYPALIEQTIALLERGLARGITPPRAALDGVEANLRAQLPEDSTDNPILRGGFGVRPEATSEEAWAERRSRVLAAVREAVEPANRKLLAYWTERYLPKARQTLGLSELPGGEAWYAYNARAVTTTDLTPEEIHQTGLTEVARIRARMEEAQSRTGFQGELAAFFEHMRTDPRFFFQDREQVLMRYRDIAKRIDPGLPRLFGRLPRLPFGIEPVAEYEERTAPTAFYRRGSTEAGRAGIFYTNTYDLRSRPSWQMEALTAHEAMPGHHLQIALAQELGELPNFRRYGHYTAFTEGWGLYAEALGYELGLYQDPYSRMGQLTYEMWRAIRLVVDTGMHVKGWSRDRAIAFFLENAPKSRHEAEVEVNRYLVWPAQALAYKIGELHLQRLRAHAQEVLGEAFDLRGFHDAVLGQGPLPLDVLTTRIEGWIAAEQERAGAPGT